jgi:hypothetical protein
MPAARGEFVQVVFGGRHASTVPKRTANRSLIAGPPSRIRRHFAARASRQMGSALVVLTSSITVYVRVSRTPGRLQMTDAIISR